MKMGKLIDGLFSSISMFTVLPVPRREWNDENIRWILIFLPVSGLIIGGIHCFCFLALGKLAFNKLIKAFILMVMPFLFSGFLHVDGFCDTCDAWLSGKPPEDRRKILKDPNMGVFAGCALVLLFLLSYICSYSLPEKGIEPLLLVFIPVASRMAAAVCVMSLKGISESGLGALFKRHSKAGDIKVMWLCIGLGAVLAYMVSGMYGLGLFGVVFGFSAAAALGAYNSFKGFSGDLAGFAIVIGEASGLVMLAA